MNDRRVSFALIPSNTEAVILRADIQDQAQFQAYVFEDRAKLDRVLLAIGLSLTFDSAEPVRSHQVTAGQLRDLLDYSECPYPCCNADCRCCQHS